MPDTTPNFGLISQIVKENYLPAWDNQLGVTPAAILSKIKKVDLKSDKIVTAAPIGLNGGFGFGKDGLAIPVAGQRAKQRFELEAKDMYCEIKISDKQLRLAKGDADSIIDVLDDEIKGSYEAAEWNVGRALFGDGTGKLATVSSVSSATLTVDDVRFVKEGLTVDVINPNSGNPSVRGTARIVAVDRVNGTVTLDAAVANTDQNDFITVQKSYANELTGFGAIFDDDITSLYGVTKSTSPYIKPIRVDAQHEITDTVLNAALRQADREKNSKIDFLCMGDTAYDAYITYLREQNKRIDDSIQLDGGFKGVRFLFGNREVAIVNEQFVPTNSIWGFETGKLELHQTSWDYMTKDGGAFTLIPGTSIFRAMLVNYGDLICKNPGGCLEISNCDPQAVTETTSEAAAESGGAAAGGSGTTTG